MDAERAGRPDRADLVHETPALNVRPMVTLRPVPGVTLRLPARAATIMGVGVLVWGALAALTPVPWEALAAATLAPPALLAALAEARIRGRSAPAAAAAIIGHYRRVRRLHRMGRAGDGRGR